MNKQPTKHYPPTCPDCGASLSHTHPTAIERHNTILRQRNIEAWTQVQRLISVGAYEERSSYDYENDTWPADGIEETAFALEEWAHKQALEFCYNHDDGTWSLVPIEMDVTPE